MIRKRAEFRGGELNCGNRVRGRADLFRKQSIEAVVGTARSEFKNNCFAALEISKRTFLRVDFTLLRCGEPDGERCKKRRVRIEIALAVRMRSDGLNFPQVVSDAVEFGGGGGGQQFQLNMNIAGESDREDNDAVGAAASRPVAVGSL